jgi:hypothetical protein
MEQKKQVSDILNELLEYNDTECNDKCISFKLSEKTHSALDKIAKKHGHSFSKMLNILFLNLMAQIIHNNYVFSPNLSEFDFQNERKGVSVTIHITNSVFQKLNKICSLNDRPKSTLAIYAALTCLKEKQNMPDINYDISPFNIIFNI